MFTIGDRVKKEEDGIFGTVISVDGDYIGVEYDKNIDGHDCSGRGRDGFCWWELKHEIVKINETETIRRNNMINYEGILRIYKERKMEGYRQERDTKKENIDDEYLKLNKDFNEKLLKQLKKDNMESKYEDYKRTSCIYTEKRRLEEKKIDDEYYSKEKELSKLIGEVDAQLRLCSNREEVLEVLKLYNITDENGKISGSEEPVCEG